MNSYRCTKCGETATSKDPVRRNVFPSDFKAALMTNVTNVMTERRENGLRMVTIEFPWNDTEEERTDDELEMSCVEMLRDLSEDNVKHWLCEHTWKRDYND